MRRRFVWGVFAALAAGVLAVPVEGQQRLGFGLSVLSDGNCHRPQRSMTAEYEQTTDALAAEGRIRSEPAGGDCRLDSFAYSVRVAPYFNIRGIDATVEFAAAQETTSAPYVLADDSGAVLLREDGGALYGANLPAGSARHVVAAVGVSRRLRAVRLGALVNLAPVDWVDHPSGPTARLTWDADWRGAYINGSVDYGADMFGVVDVGYRYDIAASRLDVGAGLTRRWGLAAVDNGAPPRQSIGGAPFLRDGPPQGHSTIVAVTIGYRIGG